MATGAAFTRTLESEQNFTTLFATDADAELNTRDLARVGLRRYLRRRERPGGRRFERERIAERIDEKVLPRERILGSEVTPVGQCLKRRVVSQQ